MRLKSLIHLGLFQIMLGMGVASIAIQLIHDYQAALNAPVGAAFLA